MVRFNVVSTQLPKDWGEGALHCNFYNGLPERLKDDIAQSLEGKPRDFLRLHELAMQYDARYWECQTEVSRKQASRRPIVQTFDHPLAPVHNPRPSPPPPRREGKKPFCPNNPHAQGSKPSNHSRPSPAPSQWPEDKLGKDGKLTAKERQYCIDNGLCLYCHQPGHRVMNCKALAEANAAKGHTATSVPSASVSTSGAQNETQSVSESKKD